MRPAIPLTAFHLLLLIEGCAETSERIQPITSNAAELVQAFPAKPVHLVEPFGAGGGPDLLARALAGPLSELWGQAAIVENVTGKGATAGPIRVAKSPADGYTLLINTSAQAYGAVLLDDLPYDPLSDFVPVVALTSQPYVLVTAPSTGIGTIAELIAAAKARPGQLKFGSTGIGTGTHVGAEKFNQAAGIVALHVPPLPTDSNANTIANVIAAHTDYCIVPVSLALPGMQDGKLIALGVTTAKRSTLMPNVPTIAESGVAGFDFPIWYGIWAPAGTPRVVIDKLANDIGRVLAGPAMRDWVGKHGGQLMTMTQPEFARFVKSESESASRIFGTAGTRH